MHAARQPNAQEKQIIDDILRLSAQAKLAGLFALCRECRLP